MNGGAAAAREQARQVDGRFGEQRRGDPGDVMYPLEPVDCDSCGELFGDQPTWAGLCRGCADRSSSCPMCGADLSGQDPAVNGCQDCADAECRGCGERNDDGDGSDGWCGNCADARSCAECGEHIADDPGDIPGHHLCRDCARELGR